MTNLNEQTEPAADATVSKSAQQPVVMCAPRYMVRKFMRCFSESRSFRWPEFFNVTDEVNSWLNKRLEITSDCSEQKIEEFTFRFNWYNERWALQ